MTSARRISLEPRRVPGWVQRYRDNHADTELITARDRLTLRSADGAVAVLHVPFPPLDLPPGTDPLDSLRTHLDSERLVGVILVRRGGYAVGLAQGRRLLDSKVGGGYVQGRTKAGGWSQQRFARRRQNQAGQVFGAAADVAARILLPRADRLDAVLLGGHRDATSAVLADDRLSPLRHLVRPGLVEVGDPRLRTLTDVVARLDDVPVDLNPLA